MHYSRRVLATVACISTFLLAVSSPAGETKDKKPKEPTAAERKIAHAIAMGHSYEKHVIGEMQFPEVKNRNDFKNLIAQLLANRTHHRELTNDREAFFDVKTNTIVIYNPHARDRGTCFRPSAGLKYFQRLK